MQKHISNSNIPILIAHSMHCCYLNVLLFTLPRLQTTLNVHILEDRVEVATNLSLCFDGILRNETSKEKMAEGKIVGLITLAIRCAFVIKIVMWHPRNQVYLFSIVNQKDPFVHQNSSLFCNPKKKKSFSYISLIFFKLS